MCIVGQVVRLHQWPDLLWLVGQKNSDLKSIECLNSSRLNRNGVAAMGMVGGSSVGVNVVARSVVVHVVQYKGRLDRAEILWSCSGKVL